MKTISLSTADDALFVDGLPAPVTPDDWRRYHLQSFPAFADADLKETADAILYDAIEVIYSMWPGVSTLWQRHDRQVWYEKTRLCFRLLICWYIADIYPDYSAGILSTAGMPIERRKIGPIDVVFSKEAVTPGSKDILTSLLSNPFGVKAHLMIKSSYGRASIKTGNFNPVPKRRH